MKTKLIGCQSVMNEVKYLFKGQNCDSEFLDYSYHAKPPILKSKLQEIIDKSQDYNLIIITLGRCSNAIIGLVSPKVPMLLPNTHECISLLLGSNKRRQDLLKENPGTYYFSQGWLDYGRTPYSEYLEYELKYGKETAQELIKSLYGRYNQAALIITPGMSDIDYYRTQVKEIGDFFGWGIKEIQGDLSMLNSMTKCSKLRDLIYVEPEKEVTVDMFNGGKD